MRNNKRYQELIEKRIFNYLNDVDIDFIRTSLNKKGEVSRYLDHELQAWPNADDEGNSIWGNSINYYRLSPNAKKIVIENRDKMNNKEIMSEYLHQEHNPPRKTIKTKLIETSYNKRMNNDNISLEEVQSIIREMEIVIMTKEESHKLDSNGLRQKGLAEERLNYVNLTSEDLSYIEY